MKITDLKGTALFLGVAMTAGVSAESNYSDLEMAERSNVSTKALIDGSAGNGGTSIRYKSLAASGMKAAAQTFNYQYSGGGCMKATPPDTLLGLDDVLDLPVGSRLVSLTLMTNPTSSTDSQIATIYQVENDVFSTIASVTVSDSSIPSHISDGIFFDHTLQYDGIINARLEVLGNEAEICAMRIGYISPDVASDVIFASNFFR